MNAEAKRDRVPIPQSSRVDESFQKVLASVAGTMGCIFACVGAWGLYGMYHFVRVTDLSWGMIEVTGLVFLATFYAACVAVPIVLALKWYRAWR